MPTFLLTAVGGAGRETSLGCHVKHYQKVSKIKNAPLESGASTRKKISLGRGGGTHIALPTNHLVTVILRSQSFQ